MSSVENERKQQGQDNNELFVRADEVDAGTTIITPDSQKPLSALMATDGAATTRPKPPPRPVLRRDGSAPPPPPPSQPPPAPPSPMDNVTDSLSLPQLRQLVNQFPKTEQRAYAYQYRDTEEYVIEVDEWFHYTELEQDREYLLAAREVFEQRWRVFCESELSSEDASWTEIAADVREHFTKSLVSDVEVDDITVRHEALASIYYILVGVWSVTAGLESHEESDDGEKTSTHQNTVQVKWMHKGADLIAACGAVKAIYECLRTVLKQSGEPKQRQPTDEGYETVFDDLGYREISLCMACLYLITESARSRYKTPESRPIRKALSSLHPNIQVYLVGVISRLRWDESYNIPLMHALQLLWKSILLIFGDVEEDLDKIKNVLQPRIDRRSTEEAHPILTTSPLDYHLFRQEVTSKYPAYNPPPPLIPLEIEQKSMLPPLPTASRQEAIDGYSGHINNNAVAGSILHQPVHIATPAPSPPPSPAGPGGKGGKKQNYQTNQNFPFLYPPLDSASNNIGGKGTTDYQDTMVGKKWEGSDIPASIIEAGELFASRMRMTRAMKQLWTERDLFMKYDRGWNNHISSSKLGNVDDKKTAHEEQAEKNLNADAQERLAAVEEFFHHALPDLQSLIIVMMKVMLTNVQDIAVRNGVMQDGQANGLNRNKSNPNLTQNQSLPTPPPAPRPDEILLEDLDNIRSREISQKAISATLFLLSKWFKISHVLRFEYITQLLLDSNYIQLTLKYFAHQNLEDLVAFSYDRHDLSFWHYCHLHSDHPPLSPTSPDSQPDSEPEHDDTSSADEAVPPPIQRHRPSPMSRSDDLPPTTLVASPEDSTRQDVLNNPTVDELGNPTAPLPQTPITEYSARQFQTSIHLLRTMQKLTKSKSHRVLLLVQFKSSQILRRILRVPDQLLRLYVLKLFKSQVPYCGRKWRQSNMRVITAIYLHCRPELRDDWLAGMHDSNVEGEVDEAVPLEWALRGLTFWWMKRTYPEIMKQKSLNSKAQKKEENAEDNDNDGGGQEIEDEERDFFQRELDAMGWGMAALNLSAGEEVGFGEEAPGVVSAIPIGADGTNGEHHQTWENNSAGSSGGLDPWS